MISWITSAGTLLAVWLTARNVRLSWKVSLVNQALWLVFIVSYDAWGLLPLTLALSGVFIHHLWTTRERDSRRYGRQWSQPVEDATVLLNEPDWDDGRRVSYHPTGAQACALC